MNEFVCEDKKRMNIILYSASAFVYFKLYWFLYSYIIFSLLSIPLEAIIILDIIFLCIFILSVIPCSFFLKSMVLRFLKVQK